MDFTSTLALEHFRSSYNDYCLILSDVRMPGMDGFEFAKNVRNIDQKVKILLMSAFEIMDFSEISSVLPFPKIHGFIQKPISIRKLESVIEEHLLELDNKAHQSTYFEADIKNKI